MQQPLLKRLTRFRENILVILSIIYGIGYFSWSIYAYKESLGVVSAVEVQYFVSGLPPFIFIMIIYFIYLYEARMLAKLSNNTTLINIDRINIIVIIIIFFFISTVLYMPFYKLLYNIFKSIWSGYELKKFNITKILNFLSENLLAFILIYFYYLIYPATYTMVMEHHKLKEFYSSMNLKQINRIPSILRPIVYSTIMLLTLNLYYRKLFPILPQEFGGTRPKMCLFEGKVEDFLIPRSDKILSNIYSEDCNIILSDTVLVYYYNDEKFVIKPKKDPTKVYELSRDIIKTITWIE
ncbi:hypothetical protein [Spirosoma radiotolerans]|uniref:Uncharacterized protein n=1 Tax=Spirosoma radiotolerans TaxID=1379870 RepID=A0A0E3ZRY8_9BACT|nr:hypothetical protein [Spirosoma radiotolerans]AKD54039.1 hypothetical protein SD10_03085 [Spirosoma radiotolerans]